MELGQWRVGYPTSPLDVGDLAPSWTTQLRRWLDDALAAGLPEPNAMVLATCDEDGRPASRTVLCKEIDDRGVVFFTNYTSAKSHQLSRTLAASATFPWVPLHRQAHIRGSVERTSAEETAAYWATRPRGAQVGAWASPQSTVVADRRALDDAVAAVERRFADVSPVPPPPHWGGWRIRPDSVEFWQGRENRLHDRLRFRLTAERVWVVERLAP